MWINPKEKAKLIDQLSKAVLLLDDLWLQLSHGRANSFPSDTLSTLHTARGHIEQAMKAVYRGRRKRNG